MSVKDNAAQRHDAIEPVADTTRLLLPPAMLTARSVSYRLGTGRYLVRDISLTVPTGSILALAGPNGAGKSTLLRLLAGIERRGSSDVHLKGEPLSSLTDRERARRLAFVGQIDIPDRRLRVHDYVALGRIPHDRGVSRPDHARAIEEAISVLGLEASVDKPLGNLSGGELQRAGIARALCQQPEILFLDEPTNHLDPRAKGELLSLVKARDITCVCVLHELALIPGLASHTALIDGGRLVAAGPTADVLTPERVHAVFGVDFLHLSHPTDARTLPVLDIRISDITPRSVSPRRENA